MNKKEKLKARKEAYKIWGRARGKVNLGRISRETGLTEKELKEYKVTDKWEEKLEKALKNNVFEKKAKEKVKEIKYKPEKKKDIDELEEILLKSGLPPRRQLFVMYYLQSYNVTWSATQAGYSKHSANVRGATVMHDPVVIETINKVKSLMHKNIFIEAHDILNEYIEIAFADITNFVEFDGRRVNLKPSDQVNGRLITEVKQGRDGITIKMADKMKALEKLEKLFEILPDKRLELDQKKFELAERIANKEGDGASHVTIINDIT